MVKTMNNEYGFINGQPGVKVITDVSEELPFAYSRREDGSLSLIAMGKNIKDTMALAEANDDAALSNIFATMAKEDELVKLSKLGK